MKLSIALALAATAAAPVRSDMTATFAVAGGTSPSVKVEIAQNGNARVDMGPVTFIRRAGHYYMVMPRESQPIVVDFAEMSAEMRGQYPKARADVCAGFEATSANVKIVRQGIATVRGRTGDAWFKQRADGPIPPKPEMVMSHDPALAPLGSLFAEGYRATTSVLPDCPSLKDMAAAVEGALDTGTPILFNQMELADVREGAIDPKRFELPAAPMSVEEMRKRGPSIEVHPSK
jgi:hypothetical protein